jgi:hypothetical protein
MNKDVSSNEAGRLKLQAQGRNGETDLPLATDAQGRLILSPTLNVAIQADNLNIRDLTVARDSLAVSASTLDVRDLNGSQDSVQLQSRTFAEDSDSGTIVALGSMNFLPKDVSKYAGNYYVVRNVGGVGLTVTLQIAPVNNDNYYVNDGSSFDLIAGGTQIFTPSRLMKFARIRVTAVLLGSVIVNYFGQS